MISRRGFVGAGTALLAARAFAEEWKAPERNEVKGGFDEEAADLKTAEPWQPYSDRKVRVGIAGEGVCNFGSAFGYQNHPNVEVVACTDLNPAKRRLLQERTGAKKAYPSCEEMIARAAEDGLEEMEKLHDEQRRRNEEVYGIPSSGIPGEEDSEDESDLVPQLMADNGDTSADGNEIVNSDEITSGGDDLLN